MQYPCCEPQRFTKYAAKNGKFLSLITTGGAQRGHSWGDVVSYCKEYGIGLSEDEIPWDGLYIEFPQNGVIVVNSSLPQGHKIWVALHELTHHVFHKKVACDSAQSFEKREKTKEEMDACVVASVALMPEKELTSHLENHWSATEIANHYDIPLELASLRLQIHAWSQARRRTSLWEETLAHDDTHGLKEA